ncbi:hypothetical protein [Pedobacter zeae]|uniref:Uncharacterized protein n=1 Tax=Pedobacter zeae TaxID=1737356 RepID=A0A7W6KEM0_9SPHI|nr:hypothetical protein [Pedobacter zeae]MBB4110426.1 hypothetical protein [Pedobacter zeae]
MKLTIYLWAALRGEWGFKFGPQALPNKPDWNEHEAQRNKMESRAD